MLKKLTILLLAVVYLNVASGLGIQFHYCMGQLVSLAIGHQDDDHHDCDRCGMDMEENSCCKEEQILLKLNDSHQPAAVYSSISKLIFPSLTFDHIEKNEVALFTQGRGLAYGEGEGPDRPCTDRYLFIRVLRI